MSPAPLIARLTVAVALLATASLAVAAAKPGLPVIGPRVVQAGGTFPVSIPGQQPAARAGGRLRHGERLISRLVTLGAGTRVRFGLMCPGGRVQRGLGLDSASTVVFEVVHVNHYIGARRVVVLAIARNTSGPTASGRLYGLCA
jgi:hypothetical protein